MRAPLVRRIAAAVLLLAWSAALVRAAASREAPLRKQAGAPAKVLVARKISLPGPASTARREAPPDAGPSDAALAPTIGSRDELTQPTYLRIFSSGTPHGHRAPPG